MFFFHYRFLFSLLVVVGSACGQQGMTEIKDKEEASFRFEWVYKNGETKIYRLSTATIPDAPSLPNSYRVLDGQRFLLRSSSIVSGDTVATIKVPATSEAEFGKLVLLSLEKNSFPELEEGGNIWSECTVVPRTSSDLPEGLSDEAAKSHVEGYNERMSRFMPDFKAKKRSCLLDQYGGNDQYLIVAQRVKERTRTPFTEIVASVIDKKFDAASGETIFTLSVKNTGNVNAAAINFRSDFDSSTQVVSVTPKQGSCRAAKYGGTYSSSVCYLGSVAARQAVEVQFRVVDEVAANRDRSHLRSWDIFGIAKQQSDDEAFNGTGFKLQQDY